MHKARVIIDPNHGDPEMSSEVEFGMTRSGKTRKGGIRPRKARQDSARYCVE